MQSYLISQQKTSVVDHPKGAVDRHMNGLIFDGRKDAQV
jgi:hypothetical protein